MPQDNRRINGPENILWPDFFMKDKEPKSLVQEGDKRLDNRKQLDLRPSILKVGITSETAGSAYLECGKTKIICSVYGPRDTIKRSEFSEKGQLTCEFKFAPYSCKVRKSHIPGNDEKVISLAILQALESVVLVEKFPKARLDIFLMVLDNDGSVIANALTCAGAALCNAGVEMYDTVVGCSLRQYGNFSLLDPTYEEEVLPDEAELNHGRITLGLMPKLNQVVMLIQDGEFEVQVLSNCLKELTSVCHKISTLVNKCLWQSARSEENETSSKT